MIDSFQQKSYLHRMCLNVLRRKNNFALINSIKIAPTHFNCFLITSQILLDPVVILIFYPLGKKKWKVCLLVTNFDYKF